MREFLWLLAQGILWVFVKGLVVDIIEKLLVGICEKRALCGLHVLLISILEEKKVVRLM